MSKRRSGARPIGASIGRLVVLLSALAGLFAMHGMSDHGTPELSVTASSHAAMADAHAAEMTGHTQQVDVSPEPAQDHDMGLVGLCLAVLVALLVFGLVFGRWSMRPLAAWLPAAYAGLLGFARERVPRPPDLLALSIQRC